jgi:hypothetical protein
MVLWENKMARQIINAIRMGTDAKSFSFVAIRISFLYFPVIPTASDWTVLNPAALILSKKL